MDQYISLVSLESALSMYNESLDDEGAIKVGGIELFPSRILLAADPIAYHVGFYDFIAAMDMEVSDSYSTDAFFRRAELLV